MFRKNANIWKTTFIFIFASVFFALATYGALDVQLGEIDYDIWDGRGPSRMVYVTDQNNGQSCKASVWLMKAAGCRSFLRVAVVEGTINISAKSDKTTVNGIVSKGKHHRSSARAIGTFENDNKSKPLASYVGEISLRLSADADAFFTTNFDRVWLHGAIYIFNQDGQAITSVTW